MWCPWTNCCGTGKSRTSLTVFSQGVKRESTIMPQEKGAQWFGDILDIQLKKFQGNNFWSESYGDSVLRQEGTVVGWLGGEKRLMLLVTLKPLHWSQEAIHRKHDAVLTWGVKLLHEKQLPLQFSDDLNKSKDWSRKYGAPSLQFDFSFCDFHLFRNQRKLFQKGETIEWLTNLDVNFYE